MPLLDPFFATRRRIAGALVAGGLLSGATFGLVLTRLGKLIAEAPPASIANYAWNATVFGLLAAVISPMVSWTFLRRVPIWRTFAEPLGWALAGAAVALVLGVPPLILILPPLGLVAGLARLAQRYADRVVLPAAPAPPRVEKGAP